MIDLEQVIRNHISLPPANSKGWFPILCQVCNDHGKKGPRAAFNFEGGVQYNCFNCGHKATFNEQSYALTKDMKVVLHAFDVPESDWDSIDLELLGKETTRTATESKQLNTEPVEQELFPYYVKMSEIDPTDKFRMIAEDYLEQERGIDPNSYPFYMSTKDERYKGWEKWYGRLIIPIYKDDRLIFWQGRSLLDNPVKKYLSPAFIKDNVMYGYDEIYKNSTKSLYVVEGFFDAYHLKGAAVFGNTLSDPMIYHLNRSRRQKVIIPDKYGDGYVLALQAIKQGWSIATPDIPGCKDINDAIMKYGKLYVLKALVESTSSGIEAELALQFFCEDFANSNRKKSSQRTNQKSLDAEWEEFYNSV